MSSAAKSNSFSINHHIDLDDFLPCETRLDFQGEVKLPGTKYDANTNTVGLTVRALTWHVLTWRRVRAASASDAPCTGLAAGTGGRQVPQRDCDADGVKRRETHARARAPPLTHDA